MGSSHKRQRRDHALRGREEMRVEDVVDLLLLRVRI